jgi:DMSO reductase anchor subunit
MQLLKKTLYTTLTILNIFLALTAIPGGFCLITGIAAPPVEELKDAIFTDYTIPGLVLMIIVGGSALLTGILLIRKNKYAVLLSAAVGLIIMVFEYVQVLEIRSTKGAELVMKIIYFALGVVIIK